MYVIRNARCLLIVSIMSFSNVDKGAAIKQYGIHGNDTGSSSVQIALMTARIEALLIHSKQHKKDRHSNRGLLNLVNNRRRMLSYLKSKDFVRYSNLIKALGLRR